MTTATASAASGDHDCGSVAVLMEVEQRLMLAGEQEDERCRRERDPAESEQVMEKSLPRRRNEQP